MNINTVEIKHIKMAGYLEVLMNSFQVCDQSDLNWMQYFKWGLT